jgi:hypothetical protein
MAAYTELPIVDPDELGYHVGTEGTFATTFSASTEELVINVTTKTIALKVTGNLDQDGATVKAVYSKLKDAWRSNATLIKFPFPMGPITDEQFELINGWNWDKTQSSGAATQTTVELLRTGGWSVVSGGVDLERWTNVITLGSLGSTDQVYYQQVDADTASVNFKLTGKVNQAIQVWSDPNGDGNVADGYNRTTYLKIFVREWEKIYAQSEIFDIGVATILPQAYRYPLTNSADLKITVTTANIGTELDTGYPGTPGLPNVGVYANVRIDYLRDTNSNFYVVRGDFASATAYVIGNVVKDTGNSRWYKCILGYTSTATLPSANATNWAAYEGERLIGSNYYPFTIIVDGDTGVAASGSGAARTGQIYTAVQYQLKLATDIDDAVGAVTGKTASSLLRFVGDTLVTSAGVYVDSFNAQDTNSITFTDALGSARTFPYVAALTVNFGTNLQDDQYAKYWVFFTNDDAGSNSGRDFATTNAIIVKDADGIDMTGDVNPAWPTKRVSVSHTYNYDSNDQRGVGTYNSGDGVGDSAKTNAPITVVGIGLRTGQYVIATGTIEKSTGNSVTITSSLERNYSQGTTYP